MSHSEASPRRVGHAGRGMEPPPSYDSDTEDVEPLLSSSSSQHTQRSSPHRCSRGLVTLLTIATATTCLALSQLLLPQSWTSLIGLQRCLTVDLCSLDPSAATFCPAPPWATPSSTFRHLPAVVQQERWPPLMWKDSWEREAFNLSDRLSLSQRLRWDEPKVAKRRWRMFCHAQHMHGYGAGCFNILYAVAHCLAMAHTLHLDVSLSGYHPNYSNPKSVRMSSVLDYRQLELQLRALDMHIRLSDWRIDYLESTPYLTPTELQAQSSQVPSSLLRQLDPTASALPRLPNSNCTDGGCSDCPPSMCNSVWQGEAPVLNDWPWVPKLAWYLDRPLRDHAYEPWMSMFAKPPTQSIRQQELVVALMRDLPFSALWQQRAKFEQLKLGLHGVPYYAVHMRVEPDYQVHVAAYERETGKQFNEPWATRAVNGMLQLMQSLMPNRSMPLFVASGLSTSDPLFQRVLADYPRAIKSSPQLLRDENAIIDYLIASEAVAFVGVYASSFSHALYNRLTQLGKPAALVPLYTSMVSPWFDLPPPRQQQLMD